jgi:hypothetical protein
MNSSDPLKILLGFEVSLKPTIYRHPLLVDLTLPLLIMELLVQLKLPLYDVILIRVTLIVIIIAVVTIIHRVR